MFFLFFLIIKLYFLIPVVITQTFNPTAQLAIPTEIPTKEANTEIETQPIKVEDKLSNCSILFNILQVFYALC